MVTIQRCDDGIVQCERMRPIFSPVFSRRDWQRDWQRARPWLLALGLSTVAHAWLLQQQSGEAESPRPPAPQASPGRATVRVLSTVPVSATAPEATRTPAPKLPPARSRSAAPAATPSHTQPLTGASPAARAEATTAEPKPPAAEPTSPPHTARLAAAGEWHYILLQNGAYGRARLNWKPSGRDYSLMLERELEGRPLPAWKSQGQIDEQGLSPERYVQQRRGRDMVATNFRRDEGLISYSTSADLVPLPAGVQDRLSWWIQLAALIEARPEHYPPGSELRLPVAAFRGEAREWVFQVLDQQTLELPGASVARALHLRRLALGPYSGEIEVWLDPARGHIPVQLIMDLPDDRGWQLQLSNTPADKP
jgi:hypothetical protein